MAAILGKSKRREHFSNLTHPHNVEEDASYDIQLQTLLRQNFETRFEPLEALSLAPIRKTLPEKDDGSDDYESDWTGFSEHSQGENMAVVIDHQNLEKAEANISKEEMKLFMSAKPPIDHLNPLSSVKRRKPELQDAEEAVTDAANLKKDLALQRLLQESHLLDPKSSLTPSGQNRHKALDVRQQALGSKTSVFTQQKMPLAQRKGIIAKRAQREENRRREAKESGIVLEGAVKSRNKNTKRERGIGAPSVGKFAKGMLTLSKGDVSKIIGPPRKPKRR
ncbi:MAG: hypothetical protein Q9182_001937 [Xanthomendoza sp. 2 TL-2023]